MASGLGSLNIAALGSALLANPGLRVPWTTLTLTALPQSAAIGTAATITVATNNVLVGTKYYINITAGAKVLKRCNTATARSPSTQVGASPRTRPT